MTSEAQVVDPPKNKVVLRAQDGAFIVNLTLPDGLDDPSTFVDGAKFTLKRFNDLHWALVKE